MTERLTAEQVLGLLNDAPAGSTLVSRARSGDHYMPLMHKEADGWHGQAKHEAEAVYATPLNELQLANFAREVVTPDPASCDLFILTPEIYAQAVMIPAVYVEAEHD